MADVKACNWRALQRPVDQLRKNARKCKPCHRELARAKYREGRPDSRVAMADVIQKLNRESEIRRNDAQRTAQRHGAPELIYRLEHSSEAEAAKPGSA